MFKWGPHPLNNYIWRNKWRSHLPWHFWGNNNNSHSCAMEKRETGKEICRHFIIHPWAHLRPQLSGLLGRIQHPDHLALLQAPFPLGSWRQHSSCYFFSVSFKCREVSRLLPVSFLLSVLSFLPIYSLHLSSDQRLAGFYQMYSSCRSGLQELSFGGCLAFKLHGEFPSLPVSLGSRALFHHRNWRCQVIIASPAYWAARTRWVTQVSQARLLHSLSLNLSRWGWQLWPQSLETSPGVSMVHAATSGDQQQLQRQWRLPCTWSLPRCGQLWFWTLSLLLIFLLILRGWLCRPPGDPAN